MVFSDSSTLEPYHKFPVRNPLKVVMTLAAAKAKALILNLDVNDGPTFQVQRYPPIHVYSWVGRIPGQRDEPGSSGEEPAQ